jgi:hypothetical protein
LGEVRIEFPWSGAAADQTLSPVQEFRGALMEKLKIAAGIQV